jgi:hypothetical protein
MKISLIRDLLLLHRETKPDNAKSLVLSVQSFEYLGLKLRSRGERWLH